MSFNVGLNLKWSGAVAGWLGSRVRLIKKTQGESGEEQAGSTLVRVRAQQQQQEEEERHHAAKLFAQATAVPG